jgi:TRAP-type C4-dicarboxylate transport system permease small subunit
VADLDATSAGDDGPPAARAIRRLNGLLGVIEEVAVAVSLGILIVVSVWFAYATKVRHSTATWPYEIIRYAVFFIAMSGAALAAGRQGMFNMDLVTRSFAPRTRSYLRIGGGLIVAVLCALVVRGALDLHGHAAARDDHEILAEAHAVLAFVVGFALIGVHYLLHALAEVACWLAGQVPPDPPHGGHG